LKILLKPVFIIAIVTVVTIIGCTFSIDSAFGESESFTVAARNYYDYQIFMNSGDEIRFAIDVNGGSNDDIYFTLYSPTNVKLIDGVVYEQFTYFDKIFPAVNSGTYTFRFDNTGSMMSNKAVGFSYEIKKNTYYVYVDPLPEWATDSRNTVYDSTKAWQDTNPNLNFYIADSPEDANLRIQWVKEFGMKHVGYAYGNQFIEVGLGDSNCGGKWQPYSSYHVNWIMMHEIGHILGREHSSDPTSIMYPTAPKAEYGNVSEQFNMGGNEGMFIPLCLSQESSSIQYNVKTTDSKYGFDVYVVPSKEDFHNLLQGGSFAHYSNDDCFGEGYLEYFGVCSGVTHGTGLAIIHNSDLSSSTASINVNYSETEYTGNPSLIESKFSSQIHDTATIDVNIFGDTFDFSHSFYQNKDNSIRFEDGNGRTIHKYAEYASIGKLFDSLGMSFTNDCLIFSDGKSFCNNEDYRFTFYVNGQTHYLLSQYVFEDGDRIKIIYESIPKITSPTTIPSESILNLAETLDCSSGSYGDLCKESENVIWDKNKPLVWDDFQGVPGTFSDDHDFSTLSADDTDARIFTNVGYTVWWEKSNNIPCEYTITKLDVVASTSKIESWVHPDRIDGKEDEILKHEQGHFDIAQIHAQEFKADYEGKDFACPSGIYDDDEIFNEIDGFWLQIEDDWFAMEKTYDIETNYHEDIEAQAEWNKKIKSLLSTGEYVKETSIPKPTEEQTIEEGGGCLIATATYGSEMATQVQQLRELRDNTLLNTESGTAFMGTFNDIYYSFSPIIADYEREHPMFKEAVKLAITPMISSLSLMENANSESEVLSIGISVIALNLGMYLGVPAIVVIGIRKRI
jgi:hypothetical protein